MRTDRDKLEDSMTDTPRVCFSHVGIHVHDIEVMVGFFV